MRCHIYPNLWTKKIFNIFYIKLKCSLISNLGTYIPSWFKITTKILALLGFKKDMKKNHRILEVSGQKVGVSL